MKKRLLVLTIMIVCTLADVYGSFGLSDFQITSEKNDQQSPDIYHNIIIWSEVVNGHWGTYGRDLSTQREFHITVNGRELHSCAIYGNIVVGIGSGDKYDHIYGYDLSTSKGYQMTKIESLKSSPAVFGDIVVWQDDRNGRLLMDRINKITNGQDQSDPAIYGDIVIWIDARNFELVHMNWDIYGYNLSTQEEFRITTGVSNPIGPSVHLI